MNVSDYTFLLARPSAVRERHLAELDAIVREFPYLQSARALQLKGLYNQDSFRYNGALKVTAAYTHDRGVLFDFITSGNFSSLQEAFHREREAMIREIAVHGSEIVTVSSGRPADPLEASIRTSIGNAPETPERQADEKLGLGKPLAFSSGETHSFSEWLQLTGLRPIEREPEAPAPEDAEKQKKLDLIDRFIASNPKIIPSREEPVTLARPASQADDGALMTETLARVYLEQKKYQKAIQAYEILILKYPEKSSLFADRISDIRLLQQNNNN
jgi:tetratricopeptide (TPR) repeat protein